MTLSKVFKHKFLLLIFLTASIYWLFFYLPKTQQSASTEPLSISGRTMGTTFSIKLIHPLTEAEQTHLSNKIKHTLLEFNQTFSHWDDNSELSQLNRYEVNQVFNSSPDLYQLLVLSNQISEQTQGTFDPTIAPSVNTWGFGPTEIRFEPPKEAQIETALKQVNYQHLDLSKTNQIIKQNPLSLDLSAIAKGYAVDQLAQLLDQFKIKNYLIEIGGEIKARGMKRDMKKQNQNWRIAIESPFQSKSGRKVHRIINLPQESYSVATSGNYRNFFKYKDKIYSHTLDPKTGQPINNKIASLTVLLPANNQSTARVDALATALTVMGKNKALEFAEKHQLAILMMIIDENKVHEFSSTKFQEIGF